MTQKSSWALALVTGIGIGWYIRQAISLKSKSTPFLPQLVGLIERDLDELPQALQDRIIKELAIWYVSWERTNKAALVEVIRETLEATGVPKFLSAAQIDVLLTKLTHRLESYTTS